MSKEGIVEVPEYRNINNAGLALLSPWFPRLFQMCNLLNEEMSDFKDMKLRIRAIFLIQRLVTYENRGYKESELAFNRILVGCPFCEPLPTRLELSESEINAIESMLRGVKANWQSMNGVTLEGFQINFIERNGRIEQNDDNWLLTVDTRSYDILLDSVPWSYRRIQFGWLDKPIKVSW